MFSYFRAMMRKLSRWTPIAAARETSGLKYIGVIVASTGSPPIERRQWSELCRTHADLAAIPSAFRPNPFKPGQMIEVRPRPDCVNVVVNGRKCGTMEWAQDDSPRIVFWGDFEQVVDVARKVAEAFHADVIIDTEANPTRTTQ